MEANIATKHDDMFITSYGIKLKKQIKILMLHEIARFRIIITLF